MFKNKINAIRSLVAAGAMTVLASPAFAVLDTAPIDEAKGDLLLAAAALLTLGIAVWGAMKVAKMFGGK